LRVGAVISCIGAILQFSATAFPQLIVGRVINGVGNGESEMPGTDAWVLTFIARND
jgi:MFS family permease